jgi:hypothetical protein
LPECPVRLLAAETRLSEIPYQTTWRSEIGKSAKITTSQDQVPTCFKRSKTALSGASMGTE